MTEQYSLVANSLWMWLACGAGILWVYFQSILFIRRSVADGKKMGITSEQIRKGVKGAFMASIGPCLVLLSAMISLMTIVGSPLAWLRINFIGGVGYEIMGANLAANAMGITPGTEQMTIDYLCVATIVMTVGCLGWIIFAALFSDKMDRVNYVMTSGRKALLPIIGASAVLGCYSIMVLERVYPVNPALWSALAAGGVMFCLLTISKKKNIRWLKDWALTISMIIGMIASMIA